MLNSIIISSFLLCCSCNVARFSSMPQRATDINFDKIGLVNKPIKETVYTANTKNEYFIQINNLLNEAQILEVIGKTYSANNYGFSKFNRVDKVVFAERGARLNEWKSLAGIYYQIDEVNNQTNLYILVKITQDITGGFKENRAKKLGLVIEKYYTNTAK